MEKYLIALYAYLTFLRYVILEDQCLLESGDCRLQFSGIEQKYSRGANEELQYVVSAIKNASANFVPCKQMNCSCHETVIFNDLKPFREKGITKSMFENSIGKGIKYQVIDSKVYRQKDCNFPARCTGIEHYLLEIAGDLPDTEIIINVRDWPQINRKWNHPLTPVFSFSKTSDYWDIMYPAWSFWEGGPAIKLYPTGLGKWHQHRKSLKTASEKWPWNKKESVAFFRGSRTSDERDAIVLLSRSYPHIANAYYTKNQAWKSDADTLHAEPAEEVSLEDHCKYKYLFNYRGVAASFRFKHLFICRSLVFHVGDDWLEFFYPSLKPWVHYIPIKPDAKQDELMKLIEFFQSHDDLAAEIANRGFKHIWDNVRTKDVKCYWKKLIKDYAKLFRYKINKDDDLIEIKV